MVDIPFFHYYFSCHTNNGNISIFLPPIAHLVEKPFTKSNKHTFFGQNKKYNINALTIAPIIYL